MNVIPPDDRKQLAAEFRAAVEAAKLAHVLPEARTCDWCGRDLYTFDDHFSVDRQFMCNPCDERYTVRLPDQGMQR
jgi:hypothetical protein